VGKREYINWHNSKLLIINSLIPIYVFFKFNLKNTYNLSIFGT